MMLTREQLTDLVRYLDNTAEYLAGSDGVAASDILKHDAAQRQQLEQYDKDFKQACASYNDAVTLLHTEQKHVDQLRRQLAERERRIKELESKP